MMFLDYDTSEKKRIPAYCDRVVFRDSFSSAIELSCPSILGLTRPCKASVVRYKYHNFNIWNWIWSLLHFACEKWHGGDQLAMYLDVLLLDGSFNCTSVTTL
jgi:hypothetical protein